jgi:hypothetical protein
MDQFDWQPFGLPGASLPYVVDVGVSKVNLDPFSFNPNIKNYTYWVAGGRGPVPNTLRRGGA